MAIILNIETSTEVCSVALARDGKLLFEKENLQGLNHSELLTVYIEELLRDNQIPIADVDAVAVSKGPGSYTGLRIGVSVAKGLCYALDKPLIAVGSLDAMAHHAAGKAKAEKDDQINLLFCPMIDARRMEVYMALYDVHGKQLESVTASVIDQDPYPGYLENRKIVFFGNGAEKCRSSITHTNALFDVGIHASARFMILLAEESYKNGKFEHVAYFEPFYLKDFVATIPKNKIIP